MAANSALIASMASRRCSVVGSKYVMSRGHDLEKAVGIALSPAIERGTLEIDDGFRPDVINALHTKRYIVSTFEEVLCAQLF